jgi:hypothetical protein
MKKITYIGLIVLFAVCSIILQWLNFNLRDYNNYNLILNIIGILILFGLFIFVISIFRKNNTLLEKISIGILTITLVSNLFLSYKLFDYNRTIQIQVEYESANCEELKKRFANDLKNKELKYFQYGMGADIELYENLKTKYGIECFSMGCAKLSTIDCYNDLVNNYLKEKHSDPIVDDRW